MKNWTIIISMDGKFKPAATEAAALATWISKDEKALATLLFSVKTSQLLHIKHCTTSAAAWTKLEEVYRPTSPARKVTLFKHLINLNMAEGSPMTGHLNNFFELVDKISEIDIKIPDELISSLPKCYENFVVAIESRDDLPKPNALKSKLIEEGNRRDNGTDQNDGESTFFSKQKRSQPKNFSARKCFKCNKIGLLAASCKSSNPVVSRNTASFALLNSASTQQRNWIKTFGF